MWVMVHTPRIYKIVEASLGEAYDLGFKKGLEAGAKLSGGKKFKNKVKKALKNAYKNIQRA